ncbi:AAA family ATPase [Kribbella lupini]|uniref:AAA family ATPase n=1 Tax=Kribbella lupini TaxID=291602 RepID=A0ABP4L1J3_9ACTN
MSGVDLVIIFGPAAVGKMTVGHALCERTGFRLFHNHAIIEPMLEIFPFGSPPFARLVAEFRRRVIEEAAGSGLPGLVFTFVWDLNEPAEIDTIASYIEIAESHGGRGRLVELYSEQSERLARNGTPFRLERKASKRDLEFSQTNLLKMDADYTLNTGGSRTKAEDLIEQHDHVRIDNTHLTAQQTAERIVAAFGLGADGHH